MSETYDAAIEIREAVGELTIAVANLSNKLPTLRDWFAGQAMLSCGMDVYDLDESNLANIAQRCFAFADAMLAARHADGAAPGEGVADAEGCTGRLSATGKSSGR